MNLPRRQLALAILSASFLLLAGCIDRRDRLDEIRSTAEIAPLVKEYILAANRAFYYRSIATSLRMETDQPRDGKIMHSELEMQCPDRYHLRITGAIDLERVVIGNTKYERQNQGPWKTMPEAPPSGGAPYLGHCFFVEKNRREPVPDAAQAELVAPYWDAIQVVKGPQREYHGIPCQEYTASGSNRSPVMNCFSLGAETYLVRSQRNHMSSIEYDFNKPIKIEPPATAAAPPRPR